MIPKGCRLFGQDHATDLSAVAGNGFPRLDRKRVYGTSPRSIRAFTPVLMSLTRMGANWLFVRI